MPNTYTWVISQLDCYPEADNHTDVVFTIHWRRQAIDGAGHIGDIYGSLGVTLDLDALFTPYNELTQAQIESWLESAMGKERVAELDAKLDRQIENQINPSIINLPLPWPTTPAFSEA